MEPRKQTYVNTPEIGGLYSVAWGYRHEPAILRSFNKNGGWQMILLSYPLTGRSYDKGLYIKPIMDTHGSRVLKMDVNDLTPEQKIKYDKIIQILKS